MENTPVTSSLYGTKHSHGYSLMLSPKQPSVNVVSIFLSKVVGGHLTNGSKQKD